MPGVSTGHGFQRVQQFAKLKTVTNTDFREEKFRVFMSENEASITEVSAPSPEPTPVASTEEISYHAVEKDGVVTAIWEMQRRKHL